MKKIDYCRYYKGEKGSPFGSYPKQFFWSAEKAYADSVMSDEAFSGLSSLYANVGGEPVMDMPYELLLTMFSLWSKGQYDILGNIGEFRELLKKW